MKSRRSHHEIVSPVAGRFEVALIQDTLYNTKSKNPIVIIKKKDITHDLEPIESKFTASRNEIRTTTNENPVCFLAQIELIFVWTILLFLSLKLVAEEDKQESHK